MGLGNPGDRYVGTRHNVGFDVVDAWARRLGARVDRLDCRALTGRVRVGEAPVLLAKPQTFMNASGESVKGLVTKHEVPLERLLVVVDDVALPVGGLRLRASGSSAGQKGLQNVLDCLQTPAVPRLRLGIAGDRFDPREDRADYVLERFAKAERPVVDTAVSESCDAIETWVRDGIEAAMSRFNKVPEPPSAEPPSLRPQ